MVTSHSNVALHAVRLSRDPLDTLIVSGGRLAGAGLQSNLGLAQDGDSPRPPCRQCLHRRILVGRGRPAERPPRDDALGGRADLARRYPRVRVEPDRIFVRAGKIWTSAGVTAGIDLALAMIGEDLGEDIARRTAQNWSSTTAGRAASRSFPR